MSNFFPDEIQTESTSRYTKLQKGTTVLRMLGKPFFYYETWLDNDNGGRSPKRFALNEDIPVAELGPDGIKQVMSIKAYNYNTKGIQIWSISQKSILKAIKGYSENKKYGEPTGYDINVTKEGEGKMTRYSVIADPKEDLSDIVKAADEALEVDLELLLINGDPFMKGAVKPATVDKEVVDDIDF